MLRHLKRPVLQVTQSFSKMVVENKQRVIPKGRTFSVQYSLPKLPVPPLEQTLRKYLDTVRPLLTDDQFKATEELAERFKDKEGPTLQKMLEERAQNHVNWLSDWWKYYAYLDSRVPVVVNVSPGIVLPRQNYQGQEAQLDFVAKFIAGILDYKIMLDEQTVPVDTLGGKPLCMVQYYQLLSACRIPGIKKDSHVCIGPNDPNQSKHITVIHNNHFFSVDVYGDKGKPLNVDQLRKQLQKCVDHSQKPGAPVGILTTMDRTSWGKEYASLSKDKTNRVSFENIQKSIFVVCLDGAYPQTDVDPIDMAASILLHGGGSKAASSNRWYDKTLQFIFNSEGFVGLNYEHTTAEGPAVIGFCDHVLGYIERNQESWIGASNVQPPQRLSFNTTDKTRAAFDQAFEAIDSTVEDLMLRSLFFKHYGKGFIKKQKMSPDAFIQMAFQLAYYRIYQQPCATYETGSLRTFQLGRTDTIRSCSVASHAFTKGFDDTAVPDKEKVELLRKAIQAHRKYTDETVSGQGIDRHLMGLKLAAVENGMNIPEIFMDLAFQESTHFRLSTSQVASKFSTFLCFGPVVPDGYGVCYNPQENQIVFSVSSFNNSPETNSDLYSNTLVKSLLDMQKLLASQTPSKL